MKLFILIVSMLTFKLSLIAQQKTLETDRFCSFGPIDAKPCENSISFPYDELPMNDTIRKSIDYVLKTKMADQTYELLVMDHPTLVGMYCQPPLETTKIVIGKKYRSNYWVAMGIVLHELGHLIKHHENLCANINLESEADMFAGNALAILGARKEDIIACLAILDDKDNTLGHYPLLAERKKLYQQGYDAWVYKQDPQISFTSINPSVRWKKIGKKTLIIIDGIVDTIPTYTSNGLKNFSGGQAEPKHGILYLDRTHATYQLLNYLQSPKGIGVLINDKTGITCVRTGGYEFALYNKATIIKREETPDTVPQKGDNDYDYEVNYKVKGEAKARLLYIPNFFYTPIGKLMPALFR